MTKAAAKLAETEDELLVRFWLNEFPMCADDVASAMQHTEWWACDVMRIPAAHSKTAIDDMKNHIKTRLKLPKPSGKAPKIPVVGAILFNHARDKILVVSPQYKGKLSFPKGKLARGESYELGACREVLEETGLDISEIIDSTQKAEFVLANVPWVLFFVSLPPKTTPTGSCLRGEISHIRSMAIDELRRSNVLGFNEVKDQILAFQRTGRIDG